MAFLGSEKAIVHQHCRVQQELSGKSRDTGHSKGQGRKRRARPHDACNLGKLQFVTGIMDEVGFWS